MEKSAFVLVLFLAFFVCSASSAHARGKVHQAMEDLCNARDSSDAAEQTRLLNSALHNIETANPASLYGRQDTVEADIQMALSDLTAGNTNLVPSHIAAAISELRQPSRLVTPLQ